MTRLVCFLSVFIRAHPWLNRICLGQACYQVPTPAGKVPTFSRLLEAFLGVVIDRSRDNGLENGWQ
jgi:hypothetical protein